MAFLDNSGDIILDAVLTDTGRMRLARGDGSFRIAKFALGDDEIDYGLYDKNNLNGSAYYDLQILQTPVLEALTNNTSVLTSKLISINRNNVFYLPVMRVNNFGISQLYNDLHYVVLVDATTVDQLTNNGATPLATPGLINGATVGAAQNQICVDQGLNTTKITANTALSPELIETAYIVEMDNRLGQLFPPAAGAVGGTTAATAGSLSALSYSFIDDDQVASYYASLQTGQSIVSAIATGVNVNSSIAGPRGTRLQFRLGSSLELKSSTYLFDTFGNLGTTSITNETITIAGSSYRYIDTTVRATGVSTGYRIDLPVRYVKYIL